MTETEHIAHVVHTLVVEIGITVLIAGVVAYVFHLLRLPLILSYLVTGVVVGANVGFGLVHSEVGLYTISEIGLVLLLFMIGLEIDVAKLKAAGSSLIATGVLQFLVSTTLGLGVFVLVAPFIHGGPYSVFYLAVGSAISSTAVVVKLLYSKFELDTLSGRLTIGILVFQDIWALVILGLQPNLANPDVLTIGVSFLKMTIMIAAGIIVSRIALPHVYKRIAKSPELIIVTSLAWCVAVCSLAMVLGLSVELGALIAGIGLSTFPYTVDVEAKLRNVRDVLVMLFFVSLGMMMPSPFQTPLLVFLGFLVAVFVIAARLLSVYPFLKVLNNGNRVSLTTSLNLSNVSEFSLVIAAIGIREGHIASSVLTVLTYAFLFGALGAFILIGRSEQIQQWISNSVLRRLGLSDTVRTDEHHRAGEGKDIAFLGFFRTASSMIEDFRRLEMQLGEHRLLERTIVVDFNEASHEKLRARGVTTVYGDVAHIDTLHGAGIEHAKLVISSIPDSVLVGTTNQRITEGIRLLCPQAKVIATAESLREAVYLYDAGADYVLVPSIVQSEHLQTITQLLLSAANGDHEAMKHAEQLREDHMNTLRTRVEVLG